MEPIKRSVEKLFDTSIRYIVPMFQRHYEWGENPQWSMLWEDVTEKAMLRIQGAEPNPHYLGALIVEGVRPSSSREVLRFLVIDGQQRLTTFQLLLCAFRNIARKNEWRMVDKKVTRYIENPDQDVMENPAEERFKLWPTTLNRSVFAGILSAEEHAEVINRFPLVRLPRKRKPEPRGNLVEAYLYFAKQIEDWVASTVANYEKEPEEVAFSLLNALERDLLVVQIVLSDVDDSQEIFYSLNSQAKPLKQSDLLRSLIFMRAEKEKIDRDKVFDEYWCKFEDGFWSQEGKLRNRELSNLDIGLRHFLAAKAGKVVDVRRVNEEYRSWISATPPLYATVKDELADFTRHAETYREYESAVSGKLPSTDFRRVVKDFGVSTMMPLILFLKLEADLTQDQTNECYSVLESFVARRIIKGEEAKEYNKLFVDIVNDLLRVRGTAVLPALTKKLLSGGGTTRHWPTDTEVIDSAIHRPVFKPGSASLRLILERLELDLRTKKSEGADIPPDLQIEHVLPQAWGSNWPLQGKSVPSRFVNYPMFADGDYVELAPAIRNRNAAVHTLGNLTLLNKYLNPAANNGSFELKLGEYKHSVLRLNRYFEPLSSWDVDSIALRGQLLGEALCRIWPRPEDGS